MSQKTKKPQCLDCALRSALGTPEATKKLESAAAGLSPERLAHWQRLVGAAAAAALLLDGPVAGAGSEVGATVLIYDFVHIDTNPLLCVDFPQTSFNVGEIALGHGCADWIM